MSGEDVNGSDKSDSLVDVFHCPGSKNVAAQATKPHLCTFLFRAVTDLPHVLLLNSC